jgi:hypothetical protein
MSDYRFRPLNDDPHRGVLDTPCGPQAAEFITPKHARHLAQHRKEELELLKRLKAEIRYASDLA